MHVPPFITIPQARQIIRDHVKPGRVEQVGLVEALGRVAAADLRSDINVTPFDDSAMDGFALRCADLAQASQDSPVDLVVVAHLGAGSVFDGTLAPGQCARIMTGAMVPTGADAVVRIEDVVLPSEDPGAGGVGEAVRFVKPVALGTAIRKAGEEAKAGDVVVKAGQVIGAAGVGLLAACGNLEVPVYAKPRVGILSVGSELTSASQVPEPGMIRDSNSWAMRANVISAGGIPVFYGQIPDDYQQIKDAYQRAAAECDLVVSTGGACMGDFDLTGAVLAELGQVHFHRVNMRPGKSQPFGMIGDVPAFVLSGNPAASTVGFELYVRLAMRILEGHSQLDRPTLTAHIASDVRKKDPRLFMERGFLTQTDDGRLQVELFRKQSSALFGALHQANCLVVIPEGLEGLSAGDPVTCVLTCADESVPLRSTFDGGLSR